MRQVVEQILGRHGRLDVLINAVGGYAGGSTLWDTPPEVFDQMIALNLRSGFALSRIVVPVMLKQGSGAIINISSRMAVDHGAGAGAYAASKAAALAMMDSLAADLKGTRIRVNSVLRASSTLRPTGRRCPKPYLPQVAKAGKRLPGSFFFSAARTPDLSAVQPYRSTATRNYAFSW